MRRSKHAKQVFDELLKCSKEITPAPQGEQVQSLVIGQAKRIHAYFSGPSRRSFLTSSHRPVNGKKVSERLSGRRWESTSSSASVKSKLNVSELQKELSKVAVPAKSVKNAIYSRLPAQMQQAIFNARQPGNAQRVIKLQLEAFWQRHSRAILITAGVFLVYSLWRTLFYFANAFFKFSESMADLGFLALAAALASFGFLYLRRLYTINPDSVYRKAMYQLNTNPGILEVMGAPVAGSSLRATVVRGGGLTLKGYMPKIRSKKVQMIFPLTGSERRGLVSLEAKKQSGRYLFKLLAVDAPTQSGAEQRIFLEGDQKAYDRGGVINELRDPFLNALSLKESDEAEDDLDDAAEEATEAQERREKAASKLKSAKSPGQNGGMYFYERTYWKVRNALAGASKSTSTAAPSRPDKAEADINVERVSQAAPPIDKPPTHSDKQHVAQAAEKLNTASDPKPPIDAEASKLHQYKKEASVQQAP